MEASQTDPVLVLIEIPKGSRNKYELNDESGELEFDRRLFGAARRDGIDRQGQGRKLGMPVLGSRCGESAA